MSDSHDLFITEIDSERKNYKDLDLLVNVRKEHSKIKEVISAFRSKVDRLIDKQRQEYIQAYESHVQDVQKELHTLRDKVYEIANDDTKNERTEKLKNDLKHYKTEALKLETGSEDLRISMARLVQKIYSAEKSRDWMLKRLRQAKKKYTELFREKMRIIEDFSVASNSQSGPYSSSHYTVEIKPQDNLPSSYVKVSRKVDRNLKNHAAVQRQILLPDIVPKSTIQTPTEEPLRRSTAQSKSSGSLQWRDKSAMMDRSNITPDESSELIELRSSIHEVRGFLGVCKESLHKRPWNKVHSRDLNQLIEHSKQLIASPAVYDPQQILPFACELAVRDEVYDILKDLLMSQPERADSPSNRAKTPMLAPARQSFIDSSILNWKPN